MSNKPLTFDGWHAPESNYSRLPHQFIALMQHIDTLAEMKVIIYILRHTWGHQYFNGKPREITLDEFVNGIVDTTKGVRVDEGCGLKQNAVRQGLKRAKEHGFILHEQDDSDKARVRNSYMLVMTSVIQGDPTDYSESSNESLRVIQQITPSSAVDHSIIKKKVEQESSDKKKGEGIAHTPAQAPTPTPTATGTPESTPVVEAESVASSTVTGEQPPPPVAPTPAPDAERRCEHCDRMRPRSAFLKTGWKPKWARDDQLDERCALCRADKPHLPEDDLAEYQRRQDAAAKGAMEDAARKRAMTATPAEADRVFVANHPLWIAFADAWASATTTPDHPAGIRPVIENAADYRDYLVQLEEQGAKTEHMSTLATQKLKAGKSAYSLKWAVADIVGVMTAAVLEQRKPSAPPTPPRIPVYTAPETTTAPSMTLEEIKAMQRQAREALVQEGEAE